MGVSISDARGAITVDATQATGNQNFAVSLDVREGRIELEIGDNGTILYEEDVDKIASITFRAGAQNDSLVIDFSNGAPIPAGGIDFVATGAPAPGAPADSLQFVNGTVNSVAYSLTNPTDGQVLIAAGSQLSTVRFSGTAEAITDTLTAANRSFSIGAEISQVQFAPKVLDSPTVIAGLTQLSVASGTTIDFLAPSELNVTADPQAAQTVDVHGLGAAFNSNLTIIGGSGTTVDFSAPTNLGTGSVSVTADSIEVDAPVATASGTIDLRATTQLVVSAAGGLSTSASAIDLGAPQITQHGIITAHAVGSVRLDAGPGGTLVDSGIIDASSTTLGGHGGTVDLFGKYVALTGRAQVNVSGSDGGGRVRIGGDYHGENSSVQNATETYIGQNVTIEADALESGNGGRVIVWSDQVTWFYGEVTARGGASGGNGGFAEISSAQGLTEQGLVDLTAHAGQTGSLVLDPRTITLVDTAPPAPNDGQLPVVPFYASPGNTFTISEAALENSSANIILQATDSITVGNLTASDVILLKPGVSITLETRNDAGQGDNPAGGITLWNTAIQTQGSGTITLEAGVNADSNGAILTRQGAANIQTASLITAGGSITVEASGTTRVLGSINSAGGAVALTADSAGTGTGLLFIGTGPPSTFATGGNSLTLTGATLFMNAGLSINAGHGTVFFRTTAGHTIGVGNNVSGIYQISPFRPLIAGNVVIGGPGAGDISVNGTGGPAFAGVSGKVDFVATDGSHSVAFVGPAIFPALSVEATAGIVVSQFITTTSGALSLDGNFGNQSAAGDTITLAADVVLTSAGALTLKGATVAGMPAAGALTLSAANGITLESSLLLSSPAAVTVNADSTGAGVGIFTQAGGTTLNTDGGALTITAADVDLAGSLMSGAAATKFFATNQRTVAIGGSVSGAFSLDEGELARITGGGLTVGQSAGGTDGSILVGQVTPADIAGISGTLTLNARGHGQSVSFSGGNYTFPALVVNADNGIAFDDANSVVRTTSGNLSLNADANGAADGQDNLSFAAGMKLSAAGSLSLAATNGGMTAAGALELDATTGVTILNSLTTSGSLTIDAGADGIVKIGNPIPAAVINTQNHALTITSAGLVLSTTTVLNAGSGPTGGTITLQTSGGRTFGLGRAAGAYALSNKFLADLIAQDLVIGGDGGGSVAVDGTSGPLAPNISGTVTLLATDPGRTVTFQGTANYFRSLSVVADAGIFVNAQTSTTVGDLSLTVNSNATPSAIGFASGVVLTSAGSLTLLDNTSAGGFMGAGALTLKAADGITLGNNLTTAGTTTINADSETGVDESEGSGSGLLQVAPGVAVDTNNGALNLIFEAFSFGAGATLDSGAATTTFAPVDGVTIGVGNALGQVTIDSATLAEVRAGSLVIGGSQNGNITVDGVTLADLANIPGSVSLLATARNASIQFVNHPSSFDALSASAANGVSVQSDLTTTTGSLSLNGDSDNIPAFVGPADDIVFSPGVSLTSAGAISLAAKTRGMSDAGALTLTAVNGVTLSSNLTTNGTTTLNADSESGTDETETATSSRFVLAAGATLNTTGNALFITAEDVGISGTIDSGAATTTLTAADGRAIHLGTAGTGFNLSGAELQCITAAELDLNSPSSMGATHTVGGISAAQSASVGKVVLGALQAGDKILFTGTASAFHAFTGFADADISVNAAVSTVPGDLFLQSNNTLTVNAPVSTLPGAGGVLTIVGGVVVNSSINVGKGNVTLIAGGSPDIVVSRDISPNGRISATTIDLEALRDVIVDRPLQTTTSNADIILVGDKNHTGVGGVWITPTGFVNSGANVAISGSLLHGTEVPGFTGPAGSVRIDANVNSGTNAVSAVGNITITNNPATPAGADVFVDGAVVSTDTGNIDIASQHEIQIGTTISSAGGNVSFHAPVLLTAATSVVSNAGASSGGDITFDAAVDSSPSTHNDLTVSAGAGSVTFSGPVGGSQPPGTLAVVSSGGVVESLGLIAASLDVNSAGDITLDGSVTTTGSFAATADSDHNGTGMVTLGAGVTVRTNGNPLSIAAANLLWQGAGATLAALDSGSAGTTIEASNAETIGLGSAAGDMTITEGELQNVASGDLTIGGANTGAITVDAVTTTGIQGPVVLMAGASGAGITFQNGASSFAALSALANSGISVQTNATTTAGDLVLTAQSGQIAFTSGRILTSAGRIAVDAAAGMTDPGTLTLLANLGVEVASNLTMGGALTIDADRDQSGSGAFSLDFGAAIDTQGNLLDITAANLNLLGTISSGSAAVNLAPSTVAATIGIGASGTSFLLSNAEIGNIVNTTGPVTIGSATNLGGAQIGTTDSVNAHALNLSIVTGASIAVGNHGLTTTGNIALVADGDANGTGAITSGAGTIAANSLVLSAAQGISLNAGASTLAALNSASGDIGVSNNVGGELVIGTVGSISGVHDSGGGSINISNAGALTVDSPVIDNGGGSISVTASDPPAITGDLTINAHVYALGGNGTIFLNAGHDLIVNPSGSNLPSQVPTIPDIQTQGSGQILGTAQDKVLFGMGILIQTGVGSIVTLSPALENVAAPELTSGGVATVTGDFGNPGARNFTITVNWSDGTIDTFHFNDPGSFLFSHTYHAPPNAADPSQPIPVTVTVFDDPNSTFIGRAQPPATFAISPTNAMTVANGSTAVQTQISTPGTGFFWFISFAAVVNVSELQYTPPPTLALSPSVVQPLLMQSETIRAPAASFEATAVQERSVLMRVLDPAGKVLEQVQLSEEVLDDLPKLFRQLPDGRYQFHLQEPGERATRLLLDVILRAGKPAGETEAGQDKPPTVQEQAPAAQLPDADPRSGRRQTSDACSDILNDSKFSDDSTPGSGRYQTAEGGPPRTEDDDAWAVFLQRSAAGALIGGAVAASVEAGDWSRRVDAFLSRAERDALSRAARLARRFRRAVARDASSKSIG